MLIEIWNEVLQKFRVEGGLERFSRPFPARTRRGGQTFAQPVLGHGVLGSLVDEVRIAKDCL